MCCYTSSNSALTMPKQVHIRRRSDPLPDSLKRVDLSAED
jgi:hypothetical protein